MAAIWVSTPAPNSSAPCRAISAVLARTMWSSPRRLLLMARICWYERIAAVTVVYSLMRVSSDLVL